MKIQRIRISLLLCISAITFLLSCNQGERLKQDYEVLLEDEGISNYSCRLAGMKYIYENGSDDGFSLKIVRDLIGGRYFGEARSAIDHLLNFNGNEAELFYLKAVSFRNEYLFSEAEASIIRAINLNENPAYKIEHQNIRDEKQQWDSIQYLNSLLSSDQGNIDHLLARAEYLMRIGENYAAIFDVNQILNIDSANEDARYIRAMSYFYESDYDKSIEDLTYLNKSGKSQMRSFYLNYLESVRAIKEQSEKLMTSDQPELYINMAKALSRIKEYNSAIKILNEGLVKNRNNTRLIYAKLLVYIEMGDFSKARELVDVLKSAGVEVDEKVKLMISG